MLIGLIVAIILTIIIFMKYELDGLCSAIAGIGIILCSIIISFFSIAVIQYEPMACESVIHNVDYSKFNNYVENGVSWISLPIEIENGSGQYKTESYMVSNNLIINKDINNNTLTINKYYPKNQVLRMINLNCPMKVEFIIS